MQKRILALLLAVVLGAGCMISAMGVSADTGRVDISDYTPTMPDAINIGTIYSTSVADISLSGGSLGVWQISASQNITSVPDDYRDPTGGGYWIPSHEDVTKGTYVLSFDVRNKSPQGIAANAVFGLIDGSMGGSAAGWNWKGQYVWAQEVESDEWITVSKTFSIDYNATNSSGNSNARLKIGLGTGNTFEQYDGKENFDFRPNASFELDVGTIYFAKESAYDVTNTISASATMPGGTLSGMASVVNQVGEKGNLDQSMKYFATDMQGNSTDALQVLSGADGAYTVAVADDASLGTYVITARSDAYNRGKTENFMQKSVVVTVTDADYNDTVAIVPEQLGKMTKLTEQGGTALDYGITLDESGKFYTFSANEKQTSIPDSVARPAGGVEWEFLTGKKGEKYILTFKVRKNNNSDVVPNLVYGMGDSTMGGAPNEWIWKEQTYYALDITSDGWQTVTQEITLPCDSSSRTVITLGLGAGSGYEAWKNNPAYSFRAGGSVVVDMDSFKFVRAGASMVRNEALSAVSVFPGESIFALSEVVDAIGRKVDGDFDMEYVVLDSATRTKAARDITVSIGEYGGYTINVGENAKSGNYVAVASTKANETIFRAGLEFVVKKAYNPPSDYTPRMMCSLEGDILCVRTAFDDQNDLVQKIKGITADSNDSNNPVDFITSGLVSKDSQSMTDIERVLCNGVDEATPFKFNSSNIGANHGQSNGILATSPSHGKTYADIGSLWVDSAGVKWNLLKIVDENKLFFLSENIVTNVNKYYFKNSMSGVLKHVECAENTSDITVASALVSQQVYPSNQKTQKTVYAILGGERYIVPDGARWGCDYVEIKEKYYVMNPVLIGETLRKNRPEGGYTEPQNLAVGSPLVAYDMTYRILPDGTVFSIFDHEILEDVNFEWYGGQQCIARIDAFGGGVHRYIPKLKPFDFSGTIFDFRKPVNMNNITYPSGASFQLTKDLWEKDTAPDRQIEYFCDSTGNTVASFSGGFLPVLDGEPSKRVQNLNAAGFVYKSKKTYPYFVDSAAFADTGTKNQHIRGVAYKKYNSVAYDDISYYAINYDGDVYLYIDCHKVCTGQISLFDVLGDVAAVTQLEKSDNVNIARNGDTLTVSMEDGVYGYAVFRITKPVTETTDIKWDSAVCAQIRNNTHIEQRARLVLGFYDGLKNLIGAKTDFITLGDYETYTHTETQIPADTAEVRAFLWDVAVHLKPLSDVAKKFK